MPIIPRSVTAGDDGDCFPLPRQGKDREDFKGKGPFAPGGVGVEGLPPSANRSCKLCLTRVGRV